MCDNLQKFNKPEKRDVDYQFLNRRSYIPKTDDTFV